MLILDVSDVSHIDFLQEWIPEYLMFSSMYHLLLFARIVGCFEIKTEYQKSGLKRDNGMIIHK